jgi:ankyrin repeat protein
VRCLKPNDKNISSEFNQGRVVEQLRCGGVLEAVRVSRSGYPTRMPHSQFYQRYRLLALAEFEAVIKPGRPVDVELAAQAVMRGLTRLLWERKRTQVAMTEEEFAAKPMKEQLAVVGLQLGRTKAFFRLQTFEELEMRRGRRMQELVTRCQSIIRRFVDYKAFRKLKGAATRAQSAVRSLLARRKVQHMRHLRATVRIQCVVRRKFARIRARKAKQDIVTVQSLYRGRRDRKVAQQRKEERASLQLQAWWRMAVELRLFRKTRKQATTVSNLARRFLAKRELTRLRIEAKDLGKVRQERDRLVVEVLELKKRLEREADERKAAVAEMEQLRVQLTSQVSFPVPTDAAVLREQALTFRVAELELQLHEATSRVRSPLPDVADLEKRTAEAVPQAASEGHPTFKELEAAHARIESLQLELERSKLAVEGAEVNLLRERVADLEQSLAQSQGFVTQGSPMMQHPGDGDGDALHARIRELEFELREREARMQSLGAHTAALAVAEARILELEAELEGAKGYRARMEELEQHLKAAPGVGAEELEALLSKAREAALKEGEELASRARAESAKVLEKVPEREILPRAMAASSDARKPDPSVQLAGRVEELEDLLRARDVELADARAKLARASQRKVRRSHAEAAEASPPHHKAMPETAGGEALAGVTTQETIAKAGRAADAGDLEVEPSPVGGHKAVATKDAELQTEQWTPPRRRSVGRAGADASPARRSLGDLMGLSGRPGRELDLEAEMESSTTSSIAGRERYHSAASILSETDGPLSLLGGSTANFQDAEYDGSVLQSEDEGDGEGEGGGYAEEVSPGSPSEISVDALSGQSDRSPVRHHPEPMMETARDSIMDSARESILERFTMRGSMFASTLDGKSLWRTLTAAVNFPDDQPDKVMLVDAALKQAPPEELAAILHMTNKDNRTFLHVAASNNDAPTTELLLDHGAGPNVGDTQGNTPLHLTDDVAVTAVLLRHNANPNIPNLAQMTPLHLVSINGQAARAQMLIEAGARLDYRNQPDMLTPLHLAAKHGNEHVIRILLEHDANPDAEDRNFNRPLHLICMARETAAVKTGPTIVELLLQYKADPNLENRQGFTPLHLLCQNYEYMRDQPEMCRIAKLLLDAKANPNRPARDGCTPLHLAVKNNFEGVATLLIKNGACMTLPWKMPTAEGLRGSISVDRTSLFSRSSTEPKDKSITALEIAGPNLAIKLIEAIASPQVGPLGDASD